jgi:hypothetical protein
MPKTDEQEIIFPNVDAKEKLSNNELADSPKTAIEAETAPPFICECEEAYRSACEGLPFYQQHEAKRYCVLHYPSKEKADDFQIVFDEKK